jgi:uncharacterized membrane protein YbhN (UPF0104 family)
VSRRLTLKLVAVALVGAVALAAAAGAYADLGQVGERLGAFDWRLFAPALALTTVNYLLRFWRWQLYLRKLGVSVPPGRSLAIFGAGLTMTLSPAKAGEIIKSGLLRRGFGIAPSRTLPIVLVERISDALGIVLLAGIGLAVVGESRGLVLVGAMLGVAFLLIVLVRAPLHDRLVRLAAGRAAAVELLGARLLAGTTLLAALSWLFECAAAYLCVRGLDLDLSFAEVTVVFTIGTLAGALSFLPGGFGVAEGSMAALLLAFGDVTRTQAVAATVLIRLATLWLAFAVGLAALAAEELLARRDSGRWMANRISSRD